MPQRRALTIDRVPEAIRGLEFALDELAAVGAATGEHSRLKQHLRLLRSIEGRSAYPNDPRLRPEIAAALGDAVQFSWVASVLPRQAVRTLVDELLRALRGAAVRSASDSAEPYQLQSQLYFGAMLAAAGHDIAVKEGEGLPDFFARSGTLLHGIEIKRPTSVRNLRKTLTKGADQLANAGGRGLLVLDMSELIQSTSPDVVEQEGGQDLWRERFAEPYRRMRLTVDRILREPGSTAARPRYKSVIAYCTLAAGSAWIASPSNPSGWPEYRAMFYARRLYGAHDLSFHRGTWLREMIFTTLERFVGAVEVTEWD